MERSFARKTCRLLVASGVLVLGFVTSVPAGAQLTDVTQTPSAENEGIRKSLEEQVGAGQGDVFTPDSSLFIIKRDPFRSIRRGRQLFQRKFSRDDPYWTELRAGYGNGLVSLIRDLPNPPNQAEQNPPTPLRSAG